MGIFNRNGVQRDDYGRIPLHYAAVDQDVKSVSRLLKGGADPNDRDYNGHTPLHLAAQKNSVEVLRLLLDNGADVNAVGKKWPETPLLMAVNSPWSTPDTVRLLLERGANPHYRGAKGVDAVQFVRGLYGREWLKELFPEAREEPGAQ